MATTITSTETAALVACVGVINDRINGAIAYQRAVDSARATAGIYGMPNGGSREFADSAADHRARLAEIREDGKRMLDGPLAALGRKCLSRAVDGDTILDYPRLFRDISADLLGGTPDYVTARGKSAASNPAASATGIPRRLLVDHLGESIDDGWWNGTHKFVVKSKPIRYQSQAVVEGPPNTYADSFAYRDGRVRALTGLNAVNDAQQPVGITNPYLTPSDLTHNADITSIANWTLNTSGGPTFKVDTSVLWRGRSYSVKFTGANNAYIELVQVMPSSVFADPYRPWDVGIPIRLTTGWQGQIIVTWGSKSQTFTHADLTNGSFKHCFLDLDKDLFPVNYDMAAAPWKLKLLNTQLNTDYIYVGGFLPYPMLQFDGPYYSHFSDESEPAVESTVSWADVMVVSGKINDVLSFVYHDIAPGWAHLPSSGTATIADPAYTPEIQLYRNQSALASGATIALGTVGISAQAVSVQIANLGAGALAVNTPTNGTNTNIASCTFNQTTPITVLPGETYTLTITVTPTGAGAFSTTITMINNDASEGTTTLVISGTAA